MSNEAVARALLAKGLTTMQACVYLDEKDQKVVLVRGSDKPVGAKPSLPFLLYPLFLYTSALMCLSVHVSGSVRCC
jgi:hypothetical protein